MTTRVRLIIEYDYDIEDGTTVSDTDLAREAQDWSQGHVDITDLWGTEAHPRIRVERVQ